jgi:hypothetical protein
VISEQEKSDAFERGLCGADLRQDVDAVAIVLDHLLQAPNLPLDSLEAALDVRLVI